MVDRSARMFYENFGSVLWVSSLVCLFLAFLSSFFFLGRWSFAIFGLFSTKYLSNSKTWTNLNIYDTIIIYQISFKFGLLQYFFN